MSGCLNTALYPISVSFLGRRIMAFLMTISGALNDELTISISGYAIIAHKKAMKIQTII
jgi:hypothetical protein